MRYEEQQAADEPDVRYRVATIDGSLLRGQSRTTERGGLRKSEEHRLVTEHMDQVRQREVESTVSSIADDTSPPLCSSNPNPNVWAFCTFSCFVSRLSDR